MGGGPSRSASSTPTQPIRSMRDSDSEVGSSRNVRARTNPQMGAGAGSMVPTTPSQRHPPSSGSPGYDVNPLEVASIGGTFCQDNVPGTLKQVFSSSSTRAEHRFVGCTQYNTQAGVVLQVALVLVWWTLVKPSMCQWVNDKCRRTVLRCSLHKVSLFPFEGGALALPPSPYPLRAPQLPIHGHTCT